MIAAKTPRIEMIAVSAIVDGERAILLDRNGRAICTVNLSRVGPVDEERVLTAYVWGKAASKMVSVVSRCWPSMTSA